MSEDFQTWRAFADRTVPADPDFTNPRVRSTIIDQIIEIIDRFVSPTADAMTAQSGRAHPPGGESYCLEAWLQHGEYFGPDADLEYWEMFGDSWDPAGREVMNLLARHNLQLLNPEDVSQFHRAWIGRTASRCVASLLTGLRIAVTVDREDPQWQAEFMTLAQLLDRRLDAHLAKTLIMILFRLSKTLGHAEIERPHTAFIRLLLEDEACRHPLGETPKGEPSRD